MSLPRTPLRALGSAWAAIMLFLLLANTAAAQSKSFFYDRIDVAIDVQTDGTLDVTETMTLSYQGGPFSSANRVIALQRLDDIAAIGLREGEQEYTQADSGKQPGTFVVQRTGGSAKVSWYYAPTSDTSRTFTLRYRVVGAVRVEGASDEIWWMAIFPDRSVPVLHSRVTLNLPSAARPRPEDVTLPAEAGSISVEDNSVVVTRDTPLAAGQSLDLRVRFPAALLAAQPPRWQSAPALQPTLRPAPSSSAPAASVSSSSRSFDGCLIGIGLLVVIGSLIWRAVTGNWDFSSSRRSHRYSSGSSYDSDSSWSSSSDSGSGWSSSSSDSGWSSSSDTGSSWSSSDSGGSGGGGGGAE